MAYDFINIKAPERKVGGLTDLLYLSPLAFFGEGGIKEPDEAASSLSESVVVTDTHQFRVGKGFLQFVLSPMANGVTAATKGTPVDQKLEQTVDVFIPGSYGSLHGMIADIKNMPMIALIKDREWCSKNRYYQIGNGEHPAYITGSFESGSALRDRKGYRLKITCLKKAIWLYEGNVKFYGIRYRRYTREFNSAYF